METTLIRPLDSPRPGPRPAPGDLVYGFTGSEGAPVAVRPPLVACLAELAPPHAVVTGAAHGWDTHASVMAMLLWPGAEHRIVVPNFRHNEAHVRAMRALAGVVGFRLVIIEMPAGTGPLDRNVEMVAQSTMMIAGPRTRREGRSGTWHTVRRARGAGLPVMMLPVDELLGAG